MEKLISCICALFSFTVYVFVVATEIHYKNYQQSLPPSLLQCKFQSSFSVYKMYIIVLSHSLLKFLMQNLCTFKLSTNVSIPLQRDEYSTYDKCHSYHCYLKGSPTMRRYVFLFSTGLITSYHKSVLWKQAGRRGCMSSYLVLDTWPLITSVLFESKSDDEEVGLPL